MNSRAARATLAVVPSSPTDEGIPGRTALPAQSHRRCLFGKH